MYEHFQCNIHVYFVFIERIYIYIYTCLNNTYWTYSVFSYSNVHIDIFISTSTKKTHQQTHQNQKHPRNAEVWLYIFVGRQGSFIFQLSFSRCELLVSGRFSFCETCRNGNLTLVPIFFSSSKMPGVAVENLKRGDDDMAVVNLLPPGHVPPREIAGRRGTFGVG